MLIQNWIIHNNNLRLLLVSLITDLVFTDETKVTEVYNNINVMESVAKVLNRSTGSGYPWKTLAGKLGYKEEDVCLLEPQEDAESPTKLVFDHLKQLRPHLVPFERVIINLAEMDRYDVLKKIKERECEDFYGEYHSRAYPKSHYCSYKSC